MSEPAQPGDIATPQTVSYQLMCEVQGIRIGDEPWAAHFDPTVSAYVIDHLRSGGIAALNPIVRYRPDAVAILEHLRKTRIESGLGLDADPSDPLEVVNIYGDHVRAAFALQRVPMLRSIRVAVVINEAGDYVAAGAVENREHHPTEEELPKIAETLGRPELNRKVFWLTALVEMPGAEFRAHVKAEATEVAQS
jgi:hypothetical protein